MGNVFNGVFGNGATDVFNGVFGMDGDVPDPTVGTIRFKLPPNQNIFTLPARMQRFPLHADNEFILKEGGQS